MKEENLEKIFRELEGQFDTEEPMEGHQARFLDKLGTAQGTISMNRKKPTTWWKPLSIAASIVLLCALAIGLPNLNPSTEQQLASISPEVTETRLYFTSLIEQQVSELQSASTPQTEQLITEVLVQLKKLDENYTKLEQDLIDGGDPNLILSAMINNFQTRIALLQDVMDQIETIENYNNYDDENLTV
ncbi:hypothetical protein [Lentiprolixibacter aurantiacus]|uniref:DUF4179 domain-containing protein n=1 Tax=Lentiprolixibacter aurantiacus TaxID=2993939 RepID=A0AAE3SNP1_9FLAO|nr:hypothetical protein [Lentiprolixibacter aurantiacus]MCX2719967.1 hypothetical protein [Lentiprolixibacter aurantiacus]